MSAEIAQDENSVERVNLTIKKEKFIKIHNFEVKISSKDS